MTICDHIKDRDVVWEIINYEIDFEEKGPLLFIIKFNFITNFYFNSKQLKFQSKKDT